MATPSKPCDSNMIPNDTVWPSEAQYRDTLNSMRDAIHVVDSDLVVLLMNHQFETWCRELGLKIDNPIGKTVFELFPDLPEKVREEYRDVFENGQVLMTMDVIKTQGREVTTETSKIMFSSLR